MTYKLIGYSRTKGEKNLLKPIFYLFELNKHLFKGITKLFI